MLSSIPLVAENKAKIKQSHKRAHVINLWPKEWYYWWNLEFFDHGMGYVAPGLLEAGGIHLFKRRILAHKGS